VALDKQTQSVGDQLVGCIGGVLVDHRGARAVMTPRRTGFLSTGDRVVGERSRVPALLGLGNAGNTPLTAPPDCSPRSQEQSGTLGTVQVDRSRSSGTVRRQRSLRLFPKIGNSRTAETITSSSIPSTTRGRPWRLDTTREPAPSPWTVGDLAGQPAAPLLFTGGADGRNAARGDDGL
jgi:hypothetical protein